MPLSARAAAAARGRRSRFSGSLTAALLAALLSAAPAQADVREGFEGRYQIGSSRCTVRPVRMAFELRCPGRPLRHFFFAEREPGRTTYRSGAGSGERFEFSEERRGTGRFVRTDGTVLAVRRIAPPR